MIWKVLVVALVLSEVLEIWLIYQLGLFPWRRRFQP
jgi:hypothetical protein